MRLTQLDPNWITLSNWSSESQFSIGVSFLCPHCEIGPCAHCGKSLDKRLAVMFWPPIDPDMWMQKFQLPDNGGHRRLSGDTFETLTLDPSIGFDSPPHFHGFIVAGEVSTSYPLAGWALHL